MAGNSINVAIWECYSHALVKMFLYLYSIFYIDMLIDCVPGAILTTSAEKPPVKLVVAISCQISEKIQSSGIYVQ